MFPKGSEIFIKILAISAFSFCLPIMAQERNGWQFDSVGANSNVSKPDAQEVYEVLFKMLDRWNAHDTLIAANAKFGSKFLPPSP